MQFLNKKEIIRETKQFGGFESFDRTAIVVNLLKWRNFIFNFQLYVRDQFNWNRSNL